MRSIAAFLSVTVVLVLSACSGDDSSSGSSSQDGAAPAVCSGSCTPGKMCYAQMTNVCSGIYYCWSDTAWHCGPQDGGGPGGPPPDAGSDDGPVEATTPESGTPADAATGG